MTLIVYVDDIVITNNDESEVKLAKILKLKRGIF